MKKLITIILILLISSTIFAQTGWFQQQSGTNRSLNDVYFINSNTGWVVGDSIVLKTTNGGINWILQNLPGPSANRSVYFLNALTGYITGDKEFTVVSNVYVYKTTDGGTNWYNINTSYSSLGGVAYGNDIYASDENVIYRTFSDFPGFVSAGHIDKSTNGGANFTVTYSYGAFSGLCFINSQTGWTTSNYSADIPPSVFKIFKTTNAGINWVETYKDSSDILGGAPYSKQIQFLNANTGYVLTYGYDTLRRFMKSTDGGLNWSVTYLNHNKNQAMFFIDVNTGWIGGSWFPDSSSIAYTTNSGLNWTIQNPNSTQSINNIIFVNNLTGWAVGYGGVILKTITGGVTGINKNSELIPDRYSLFQNYPNPFNPTTNIRFDIPRSSHVKLIIYDALGREVATLVNEKLSVGSYETEWLGSSYPSGVYFYRIAIHSDRLETMDYSETKKMLMIK